MTMPHVTIHTDGGCAPNPGLGGWSAILEFDGPAGKTTIDPQTHHTVLDVYIGEAKDKKFTVVEKFSQQKPADTSAVCDLKKNPNENKQYVIDVKT